MLSQRILFTISSKRLKLNYISMHSAMLAIQVSKHLAPSRPYSYEFSLVRFIYLFIYVYIQLYLFILIEMTGKFLKSLKKFVLLFKYTVQLLVYKVFAFS